MTDKEMPDENARRLVRKVGYCCFHIYGSWKDWWTFFALYFFRDNFSGEDVILSN